MSYKLEVRETSNQSPRSNFGASSKPTGVTIHWWGSPSAGATHDGVVSWLRGRAGGTNNRNSSAHYVVSGSRVTRLAAETRATWHAGNRRGNGTTIGIEMHPRMSNQDWNTLVELCVDIERRHGSMKYYRHMDWKATACPGVYAKMIKKLVDDVNAAHGGKKPSAPSGGSTGTASKSVSQMASEVVAGKHGSGHANRQRSLGVNNATYKKVRNLVNQRAGVSTPSSSRPSKSVEAMANEIIAGRHGTGHAARQRSLGVSNSVYQQVRNRVNQKASGGGSSGGGKSISQMANEIIAGKHGNGHAQRQRSLGVNNTTYAAVRKEVNRRS